MDTNVQAPLLLIDVMIPSGGGDPVAIPQINLSILGYGPNLLRDSHVGTPAMRAKKFQYYHNWIGQYLFQQEVLLEEECQKILD